ncbi:MAG TPA: SoxR reducing system RseC family protein [bacterium]|nr:SoxR reducing system RseC family protein [bacterium]HOM26803.1 SoxR reducing system RseC family protein [bacterium]
MKEKGKIIESKEDKALVLMEEKEKCKSCGLCKKIIPRQPVIEVENIIKAEVGDNVEIEIKEDDLFEVSIYIYGFPLLGFILGIISAYFLNNMFLKVIIFLLFLISFWVFGFRKGRIYGERAKPKIISKI